MIRRGLICGGLLLAVIVTVGHGEQLRGSLTGEAVEVHQKVIAIDRNKTVSWTLPGCFDEPPGPVTLSCSVLTWDDSLKTFVWPHNVTAEHGLKVAGRWNQMSVCAQNAMGRFDGHKGCTGFQAHYANCVKTVLDGCVQTSERRFLTDQDWVSIQESLRKLDTDADILRTIDALEKRVRELERQGDKRQ